MASAQPYRVKTISEFHQLRGLPRPEHPLISVVNFESIKWAPGGGPVSWVQDFYSIALKRDFNAKLKCGQQEYDFDEGVMVFISPGQVFSIEDEIDQFTAGGLRLESGRELPADLVVLATGLSFQLFGGMQLRVGGRECPAKQLMAYKGMMLSNVPNLAIAFGYTNASWTLKVGRPATCADC